MAHFVTLRLTTLPPTCLVPVHSTYSQCLSWSISPAVSLATVAFTLLRSGRWVGRLRRPGHATPGQGHACEHCSPTSTPFTAWR
jgi:hypothetical protein